MASPRIEYPADVAENMSSVGVVDITIDGKTGSVVSVAVLEAPSESAAAALRRGLMTWKFKPVGNQNGLRLVGKLTFYFVMSEGNGVVLNPDEAPYVGKWRRPNGSKPSSAAHDDRSRR